MPGYFAQEELGICASTTSAKLAALFFDRIVVPANPYYEGIPAELLFQLRTVQLDSGTMLAFEYAREVLAGDDTDKDNAHFLNDTAMFVQQALAQKGLRSVPVFTHAGSYEEYQSEGEGQALEFRVLKAPLIDVSSVEWQQICELRRDDDFKRSLRDFRLMLYADYRDKETTFVRDSLLSRIEKYEKACDRNGLRLVISTCKELLNSKSLLATVGLVTAGALTGNPVVTASGVVAVVVELGKISLEIAEAKLNMEESAAESGIAWLADLRRQTEQG